MKKAVFLVVLLLVAGAVFGQDFTFQGLPWGATKEQVIAKMGQPFFSTNKLATYSVSINGYRARLDIDFENGGMNGAVYEINYYRDLNTSQVAIAFLALFRQIEEKYGAYSELLSAMTSKLTIESRYFVWHFDNFHIAVSAVDQNNFFIVYCSNSAWNTTFEEDEIKVEKLLRFPNTGL